jgi:hypothetical protein
VSANGRHALLETYGRFYGEQHFAIAFTASTEGDDAKRVTSRGWDKTAPLADGGYGASYVAGRGLNKNPAIVLRPSNLIVLECDSEDDLIRIEALGLPETVTVRSSEPYKRHYYFRPPPELESLPFVAFRFESGKLTADSGRYFLAPPAIHPSGAVYAFLPDHGPDEMPIACLPEAVYHDLATQAEVEDDQQRDTIAIDPSARFKEGNRRGALFRYACMLRRWGLPHTEILESVLRYNNARCEPPVERHLVEVQVDGAMKKDGGQELARLHDEHAVDPQAVYTLTPRTARQIAELPDQAAEAELLGPIAVRGGRTIIVGHTGHGKTTLTYQMLHAITTSAKFLDWQGVGGKGLVVDLEQGQRSVQRGIREARLDRSDNVDYVLVPDGLALDRDLEHQRALDNLMAAGGYTVVILDPYYKAHRAEDPNAEGPIVALMRILDAFRARHGFCLIMPAHPRKPERGIATPALTVHDISGSGAVTRGAEVVLGIERVTYGFGRLRFLKDRDGDLPIGDAWELIFDRERGYRRKEQSVGKAPAEQIAAWVIANGGQATPAEVMAAHNISEGTLRERRGPLARLGIQYVKQGKQSVYVFVDLATRYPVVVPAVETATTGTGSETPDMQGKDGTPQYPAVDPLRGQKRGDLQGNLLPADPALPTGEPAPLRAALPDEENDDETRRLLALYATQPDELWQPE